MRPITITDLCELSGYSRDQMRGFLDELPRFASRPTEARVARIFSNQDVLVVVVLCHLEKMHGLKRSVISSLCDLIATTLLAPRKVSKEAWLTIQTNGECEYWDVMPQINEGFVIALSPLFFAIDSYLLPNPLVQREVGLSATATNFKNRSKSVSEAHHKRTGQETKPQEHPRKGNSHG